MIKFGNIRSGDHIIHLHFYFVQSPKVNFFSDIQSVDIREPFFPFFVSVGNL